MTELQIRLGCLREALKLRRVVKQNIEHRTKVFMDYVAGDEVRLGCLQIAVSELGSTVRASEGIVEIAKAYEAVIVLPAPEVPVPKRRGRPPKEKF